MSSRTFSIVDCKASNQLTVGKEYLEEEQERNWHSSEDSEQKNDPANFQVGWRVICTE